MVVLLPTPAGGKLGLFELFKKKSEEELFQEAVADQDYEKIVELGEKLLKKHPNSLAVINPYTDALVKLGKKDRAVQILVDYGEKKVDEEYYELAIPILKKALKIDPLNIKAIKLLTEAYKREELFYDAFKVLIESLKIYKEAALNTEPVKELLESFLQEQFHPLFYEKYADLLLEEGEKERALINYILAANLYINLRNYKSALRSFLKAEKIGKNKNIDKQIVEVLAHLDTETITPLLLSFFNEYKDDVDFIQFTVESFKETNRLNTLKEIAKYVKNPTVRYALLALTAYEQGELEEGQEYLEKLKLVDRDMYEKVSSRVKEKYPVLPTYVEPTKAEALPEPEQVMEILDQALDFKDLVSEYVDKIEYEEKPEEISKEIQMLKELKEEKEKLLPNVEEFLKENR